MCRVGPLRVALPVGQVAEVMRLLPIRQVAGVPPYILGLSIVRGAPVPVVDVGLMINGLPRRAALLVTAKTAERIVALAVEEVGGLVGFAAATFGQLPPLLQDAAAATVAGVAARDAELLVLLNASRLVPDGVLAVLDAEATRS